MLTEEDELELRALAARGWSRSAIARHTGRDRKTVAKYLLPAEARPVRAPAPSCLEPHRAVIATRFAEDPHLGARALHRELVEDGFDRSYQTLVRELRRLGLRPVCPVCERCRSEGLVAEADRPPGEEMQWEWLELHDTPWGRPMFVLFGVLSHSGRFRAVLCEQGTFGYVAEAMHRVLVELGGTPRIWCADTLAAVVIPGTDRLTPEAELLARHYGVRVDLSTPRRTQRTGAVDAAVNRTMRSWWPGAPTTLRDAQPALDRWCATVADQDAATGSGGDGGGDGGGGGTTGERGAAEPLGPLPARPYPVVIAVECTASRAALVSFEGNRYSVPPAYAGRTVTVHVRAGERVLRITGRAGVLVARHRRARAGGGQAVRTPAHAAALVRAVRGAAAA